MISSVLTELAWQFALLSFLAIGGVNTLIPEIHRRVVDVEHWMTDTDFAQAFAIAQAAPGPNLLIVSLIGWKVSGVLGALVATAAICIPSSLLTFAVAHVWDRFREAPLRAAIQHGLAPVTVGLVLATGYILARTVAPPRALRDSFRAWLACPSYPISSSISRASRLASSARRSSRSASTVPSSFAPRYRR